MSYAKQQFPWETELQLQCSWYHFSWDREPGLDEGLGTELDTIPDDKRQGGKAVSRTRSPKASSRSPKASSRSKPIDDKKNLHYHQVHLLLPHALLFPRPLPSSTTPNPPKCSSLGTPAPSFFHRSDRTCCPQAVLSLSRIVWPMDMMCLQMDPCI